MPRLGTTDDMETHKLGGNFTFSGARIQNLGATEYTLATVMIDNTGSIASHAGELLDMLLAAVNACQKSPRSDNLLLRVCTFSTSKKDNGVEELHGFKPLAEINIADYAAMSCYGSTNLYDAAYSGIAATNAYADQLDAQDFLVNAITFVITDGEDNASVATPAMVRTESARSVSGEVLESHISILIGVVSSPDSARMLKVFKDDAGLTQFIDAGEVSKGKLAKLAAFVSQSISSTSQALGSGGASQAIQATL